MRFQVDITFDAEDEQDASSVVKSVRMMLTNLGVKPMLGTPELAPEGSDELVVYTDGGCDLRRGGLGAWAFMYSTNQQITHQSDAYVGTTNNRMEMMGVIKALESIPLGKPIRIVSDSEYVIKGATQWSRNWVRNGWRTRDGKPVVNKDLWQRLLDLCSVHTVQFYHVKGHTGVEGNEFVDTLCTQAMTQAGELLAQGHNIQQDIVQEDERAA